MGGLGGVPREMSCGGTQFLIFCPQNGGSFVAGLENGSQKGGGTKLRGGGRKGGGGSILGCPG